ncbi:MAG: ABC transporter permease [Verrucomicrobiota bacterium]
MKRAALLLLDHAVVVLFAGVLLIFGFLAPGFLSWASLGNLLIQSSPTAILAVGMTFVLMVAGVDLSVGAAMAVAAAVAGKMMLGGWSMPLALGAMLLIGTACGLINGLLVTRLKIAAFIATLGTLWLGRGCALWITETRAMNLPDSFLHLGSSRLFGIPLPGIVCAMVLAAGHFLLERTPFGRQLRATGHSAEAAAKAGINVRRLLTIAYVICGLCAALGGILALAQLGAVSPKFGLNREFAAIAAAVLGGTSLFGGRGSVFPGSLLGAALIQSVENGLVAINANPYLYPVVTSAVIFLAVLLDTLRQRFRAGMTRQIFQETESEANSAAVT